VSHKVFPIEWVHKTPFQNYSAELHARKMSGKISGIGGTGEDAREGHYAVWVTDE